MALVGTWLVLLHIITVVMGTAPWGDSNFFLFFFFSPWQARNSCVLEHILTLYVCRKDFRSFRSF